ncbi:tRNA lysidine(34) synthetase TilS [Clostridium neuense]|uniref:tRNA(Ile)-lysidine synthase n=1 Tax=Clostridium neuense TaxID=1728934 RepID=A0ABW8THV7_9CLOT
MIDKVIETIEKNSMFNKGDRVVVAVSGGPDSICLLHLLNSIKSKFDMEICAAHVNHCLRGAEADADEEFVRRFCEELNVDFYVKRVDINKLAKEKKLSSELAGREARYDFFEEVMEKFRGNKIAIAHNANDRAETILMRIIRGTGLDGMVGIKPMRDEVFVRPLINTSRNDIEKYCLDNKISPRIDKTNLERLYTRNKIRLDLIPYIMNNFNEDVVAALNRLGDIVSIDNDYMQKIANKKYDSYCYLDEKNIIIKKEAFCEHEAVLSRMIRRAISELTGNVYNIEKKHVEDIIHIQQVGTGKKVNLPNNIVAHNNYGDICFEVKSNDIIDNKKIYEASIENSHVISFNGFKFEVTLLESKTDIKLKQDDYVKYFDANKVGTNISIRYRNDGDKFKPLGMKSFKKLKDIFINLKIPREDRIKIPLICFGNEIAWIVGHKISEDFKIDDQTKTILKIKVEREDN